MQIVITVKAVNDNKGIVTKPNQAKNLAVQGTPKPQGAVLSGKTR